jgi:regulator of sigma E protease
MTQKPDLLINTLLAAAAAVAVVLWWELFRTPVMFFVTLGILVAIHEWGHFIAAKAAGVRVYEFALGFGPKLVTYMRRGGTEYTVRAIPLGGFVNLKGMQPDDPLTPDGLNGRSPSERALVYLAGPLMNMILAVVVLLLAGFLLGTPDDSKVLVGNVERKLPANRLQVVSVNGQPAQNYRPGLRVGDRVVRINGKPVDSDATVVSEIHASSGEAVTLEVQRGADTLVLTGVPQRTKAENRYLTITRAPTAGSLPVQPGDLLEQINGNYVLGSRTETPEQMALRLLRENAGQPVTLIVWRNGTERLTVQGQAAPLDLEVKPGVRYEGRLGFSPTAGQGPRVGLGESLDMGKDYLVNIFGGLAALFSRPKQLASSLSGPLGILAVIGEVGRLPLLYYFMVLAQLSVSLAVFNLLPIPILDGGHMLLLTLEVLRRRRLDPEMHKVAAMVGFAVIGALFIIILGKDIFKHFL